MSKIVNNNGKYSWLKNEILFAGEFNKYIKWYPEGFSPTNLITLKKAEQALEVETEQKLSKKVNDTKQERGKVDKLSEQLKSRFEEYNKLPRAIEFFDFFSLYIEKAIPNAADIAGEIWVCECTPSSPAKEETYYAKFYLNNHLILSVSTWNKEPRISFSLDKAGLLTKGNKVSATVGLKMTNLSLNTPSKGLASFNTTSIKAAFAVLKNEKFLKAVQQYNSSLINGEIYKSTHHHDDKMAKLLLN